MSTHKILVVEDEQAIREMIVFHLTQKTVALRVACWLMNDQTLC
jgi:DNA-binding response OmpR family regulator